MVTRRRSMSGALAIVAILAGALAAPAPAAIPAPAWSIRSLAVPTNFTPGDESGTYRYEVMAVNSGGAATNGNPITLTDTLPAGLIAKEAGVELPAAGSTLVESVCSTEKPGESEIVRCTIPEELPSTSNPALLEPSEALRLLIRVSTPVEAEGTTLTNLAQVQGGGALPVSTTSHNAASSKPASSGLMDFRAALLGVDGLPAGQAASHPYQYTTSFAVNTTRGAPGGTSEFVPAGGDIKDVNVALPPGLIGNPTAVSRCTAQQFNTTHAIQPLGGVVTVNVLLLLADPPPLGRATVMTPVCAPDGTVT